MDQVNESGGDGALLRGWSAIQKLARNGLGGDLLETDFSPETTFALSMLSSFSFVAASCGKI
jgi:hypothetical protein